MSSKEAASGRWLSLGNSFPGMKNMLLVGAAILLWVNVGLAQSPTRTLSLTPQGDGLAQGLTLMLFVAPEGDDSHSGLLPYATDSINGALRTLDGARLAVQRNRNKGWSGPITVSFRGGVYPLSATVTFASADSGAPGSPTTYRNYPGETPVFSGGVRLPGWTRAGGDKWATKVPPRIKDVRQFFYGDSRRYRSLLPHTGYYFVAATPGTTLSTPYKEGSNQFQFLPGQISASWYHLSDVEVNLRYFWMVAHLPIKQVDESTQTVTFSKTTVWRMTDGRFLAPQGPRYQIENVYEALQAGDFYFNSHTRKLTYVAQSSDEDPNSVATYVPRLTALVVIDGGGRAHRVHDLIFSGLTFAHNQYELPRDWAGDTVAAIWIPAAVQVRAAQNITFQYCTFAHLGTYALQATFAATNLTIDRNQFFDLGAGGVKLLEEADSQTVPGEGSNHGHAITNNSIHDIGLIFNDAVGILVGNSYDNEISHNEIYNGHSVGIWLGLTWGYGPTPSRNNAVTFNHLHHLGQPEWISDLGAIYSLGMSPETRIANNVIHDISGRYLATGLYADNGTSYVTYENNIVYRTLSAGFLQNLGRENVVRNNIFYSQTAAQLYRAHVEPHLSFTFSNNITAYASGVLHTGFWQDDGVDVNNNLYFSYSGMMPRFGEGRLSFADWQQLGHDQSSSIGDPCFADPDNGDFQLCPGSPAWLIGFQAIDVSTVGPQDP